MGTRSQPEADQPPTPGGDPDQTPDDLPDPPANRDSDDGTGKKSGYGHIGNKQVPRPKGAPPPHQIFADRGAGRPP